MDRPRPTDPTSTPELLAAARRRLAVALADPTAGHAAVLDLAEGLRHLGEFAAAETANRPPAPPIAPDPALIERIAQLEGGLVELHRRFSGAGTETATRIAAFVSDLHGHLDEGPASGPSR
jgi:hypothetical protein